MDRSIQRRIKPRARMTVLGAPWAYPPFLTTGFSVRCEAVIAYGITLDMAYCEWRSRRLSRGLPVPGYDTSPT